MSVVRPGRRCLLLGALALLPLAAACASSGSPAAVQIAQPLPGQESLTYNLLDSQSNTIGAATVSIATQGNSLVLRQLYSQSNGQTDDGSVTVNATSMLPQAVTRTVATSSIHGTLNVAYGGDRVTATANDGSEHKHSAKIDPKTTYDDEEAFFLLRTLKFAPGYTVHYGIVVSDVRQATISQALGTARVLGETNIKVQGKAFRAWEVQLSGAGATNTAWIDSDSGRHLLRYVNSGNTSIELASP